MDYETREMIRFVLEDENEGMAAALAPDSDLDEKNKQMNRELIHGHEQILAKLDRNEDLSEEDLALIRDANEIHVNDTLDLGGHHQQALALEGWLYKVTEIDRPKARQMLEQWLGRDPDTPDWAYRALHILWEVALPSDAGKPAFDGQGRCLKCRSRVSFADITDTAVLVGNEIVKRYPGDITNRNCVRCTYPKQYPEYESYDTEAVRRLGRTAIRAVQPRGDEHGKMCFVQETHTREPAPRPAVQPVRPHTG